MTNQTHSTRQNTRDAVVLAKMLTPLCFIIILSLYFHTFVLNAIEANLAINCCIIAAASYGVFLILARLVGAQRDFRVIERFGQEAAQGVYMPTLLEEPWLKRRYVRHYLSHIANTGGTLTSQMEQTAIENELQALQEEYNSKLELPQFLVGFMIAMGLLGTFIGLLETLTGISSMLDGMGNSGSQVEEQFMKLIGELRKPLAGMGIAFSASMFGLITSLMLAIMMTNLRRYINRVTSVARNVMHELIELTRSSNSADTSGKHLSPDDISAMVNSPGGMMLSSRFGGGGGGNGGSVPNSILAGRFEVLGKKIEMLLEAFGTSSDNIQQLTNALHAKFDMQSACESMLGELKILNSKQDYTNTYLQSLLDAHSASTKGVHSLIESQRQSQEIENSLLSSIQNLSNGFVEQSGSLRKLVHNLNDQSAHMGSATATILETQRKGQIELADFFREMLNGLANITETNSSNARQITDFKEYFTKLCKSAGMVDLIATGVSGHTLLLESLVEETRNSQQTLVSLHQDMKDRSS